MTNDFLPPSKFLDVLEQLKESGFSHTLLVKGNNLECAETEEWFKADDVKILAIYRFEGVSDPQDMVAAYALETMNGTRGVIVDAFGAQSSPELSELLANAQDCREQSAFADQLPAEKTIVIHSSKKENGTTNS